MINALPIIGWLIALFLNVSLAVPFYICWTSCGIGVKYFSFLPTVYQHLPFWDTIGLFTVIGILRCFVPKFSTSDTKVESK